MKVGDRVIVIDNESDHEFPLGEEVTLIGVDDEGMFDFVARSDDFHEWFIDECDITPINNNKDGKEE